MSSVQFGAGGRATAGDPASKRTGWTIPSESLFKDHFIRKLIARRFAGWEVFFQDLSRPL